MMDELTTQERKERDTWIVSKIEAISLSRKVTFERASVMFTGKEYSKGWFTNEFKFRPNWESKGFMAVLWFVFGLWARSSDIIMVSSVWFWHCSDQIKMAKGRGKNEDEVENEC